MNGSGRARTSETKATRLPSAQKAGTVRLDQDLWRVETVKAIESRRRFTRRRRKASTEGDPIAHQGEPPSEGA